MLSSWGDRAAGDGIGSDWTRNRLCRTALGFSWLGIGAVVLGAPWMC